MRRLLFAAVIAAVGWIGTAPAMATSLGLPGPNASNINAGQVEKVGYWRRMYRRYGYPGPYAYYPPAYGYYPPPAAYAYPPPVYGYQPSVPAYATLHPCMAIRPLRRLRMATILPRRVIMGTIRHQRVATTVTTRRMVLKGLFSGPILGMAKP